MWRCIISAPFLEESYAQALAGKKRRSNKLSRLIWSKLNITHIQCGCKNSISDQSPASQPASRQPNSTRQSAYLLKPTQKLTHCRSLVVTSHPHVKLVSDTSIWPEDTSQPARNYILLHTALTLLQTEVFHREAFTRKSLYTEELLTHKRDNTKTFTPKHFSTQTAVTHRRFRTQTLSHTHMLLHTDAFTVRRFYTRTSCHTHACSEPSERIEKWNALVVQITLVLHLARMRKTWKTG